ncbi:hypothetical protein DFH07DRAFT_759459, partial [Mycena maculata]
PGCLEGTRERIFRKIYSWLESSDSPNILWIKGFPGSGKSCIARSVVEQLTVTPSFGSSFFFERDGGTFTAPSTMLRSIASDLSRRPLIMEALVAELEARKIDFSTASINEQFVRLVENPLRHFAHELREGNPLIIVLDALDECGGLGKFRRQDRDAVLAIIQRWSTFSPLLRLVVTSRDETSIAEVLDPISTPLALKLDSQQATRDIEEFLNAEFKRIARNYHLPDSWPTREEIRTLAKKAKGLFVWAATLVKFVDQPRPQYVLQRILRGDMDVEGDITDLYELILRISFYQDRQPSPEFVAEFNTFVGCIGTASRPLEKDSALFDILGVQAETARFICTQLRSVLMDDGKHLRFHHQSFVDFLISNFCPLGFRIIPHDSRKKTSRAIFHLLNNRLRFDPCKIRTSRDSNPAPAATTKYIPPEIYYACKSWEDCLSEDNKGDAEILSSLKTFFETKFLYWLEVLSLGGEIPCARNQLCYAAIWSTDCELLKFLEDAIAFLETFQECISKSAPHIYLSAMTFTPETSKIHQIYSPLIRPCATVKVQTAESFRRGRSDIPAPIIYSAPDAEFAEEFEGHVDDILSVLFTEDGYVASASYDATIRFWDPTSGGPVLTPFTTHKKAVTSLAFASDSKFLASGSRDGTASVWDMETHKLLATFADEDVITCVAISPAGTLLVTGSKNKTVKFWDISEEKECRAAFREHTDRVTALAFLDDNDTLSGSLDGKIYRHHISGHSEMLNSHQLQSVAVNGSRIAAAVGNRIQIWDITSGKLILGPFDGHRDVVTSMAFSEDGKRLVSGSMDRTVRIWNTGSEIGDPLGGFPEGSKIESTGWIRGPKRDLIIWVPQSYRRRLCWGRALTVIDGRPGAHITVSEALLGRRWYQCLAI